MVKVCIPPGVPTPLVIFIPRRHLGREDGEWGGDGVTPLQDVMLGHTSVGKRPGGHTDGLQMYSPARQGRGETGLGFVGQAFANPSGFRHIPSH